MGRRSLEFLTYARNAVPVGEPLKGVPYTPIVTWLKTMHIVKN